MDKIVYVILITILIFCYLWISRIVEKKYLKRNLIPLSLLVGQNFLGIPMLLSPKAYFKKETFLKGYFTYLFGYILLIIAFYLFYRLIT